MKTDLAWGGGPILSFHRITVPHPHCSHRDKGPEDSQLASPGRDTPVSTQEGHASPHGPWTEFSGKCSFNWVWKRYNSIRGAFQPYGPPSG